MRTVLLLSSLMFAACTVGETGTSNQNNGNVDAGGTIDAPATANACLDRATPATAFDHGGGVTHAGENCMVGGCHLNGNTGVNAPAFQIAGTVFKSDGTTPNPGVRIRIKPEGGAAVEPLVSDTAGNFYAAAGGINMAFPATTDVTACPTLAPMAGQLKGGAGGTNGTSDGACSKGGCHVAAGGAGVIKLADQ